MTQEEITARNQDLSGLQSEIRNMTILERTGAIFRNNMVICLIMFVPIGGLVFGIYVLYNTSVYIAAQSLANNLSPVLVLAFLLILPFAWFEFVSYSIAFSESYWFVRRLFQHRGARELKNLGILILISAGLLLLGAFIEAALI
jgi:hypothetical protein